MGPNGFQASIWTPFRVHMEAEGRPNGGLGAKPPEKGPLGPIGPYWPCFWLLCHALGLAWGRTQGALRLFALALLLLAVLLCKVPTVGASDGADKDAEVHSHAEVANRICLFQVTFHVCGFGGVQEVQ